MLGQTVLITGGTGFLGRHIVELLLAAGASVRVLSSKVSSGAADIPLAMPGVQWFDLSDRALDRAVQGVNAFINCAVVYDRPHISDDTLHEVNIALPMRILDRLAALDRTVNCILGDSFFRKYPPRATRQPRYTQSKTELFDQVQANASRFDKQLRIAFLQIEQVYGAGEAFTKAFPMLTGQMLQDVPRLALTEGLQRRDFIHVRDVASATVRLCSADWRGVILASCGSGVSTSVRAVLEKLKALTQSRSILGFGDLESDQSIADSNADPHLLLSMGWRPEVTLDEGLRALVSDIKHRQSLVGATT